MLNIETLYSAWHVTTNKATPIYCMHRIVFFLKFNSRLDLLYSTNEGHWQNSKRQTIKKLDQTMTCSTAILLAENIVKSHSKAKATVDQNMTITESQVKYNGH